MTEGKPKVAFLDGHGELDFYSTSWMAWQLQRFYNVDRVRINGRVNALNDIALKDTVSQTLTIRGNKYDVLIVAQPTEPFPDADKYVIDQFLMRGGKILWLIDATDASADSLQDCPEFFATPRNLRLNDPLVGTDFHGHTYPGAIVPFGGVQLSPDTRLDGWDGCSAYHYSDNVIYGFSHTHLSGTGCSDYGDILLMPFTGQASVINSEYCSQFSHSKEVAEPGYYSVMLDKYKVKAELTCTPHVGVHRYTYPD